MNSINSHKCGLPRFGRPGRAIPQAKVYELNSSPGHFNQGAAVSLVKAQADWFEPLVYSLK